MNSFGNEDLFPVCL